jgi:glyceraldehyde-3-phosphate dehydrogenase/erythrose-4-phosphate dehydrogenase
VDGFDATTATRVRGVVARIVHVVPLKATEIPDVLPLTIEIATAAVRIPDNTAHVEHL